MKRIAIGLVLAVLTFATHLQAQLGGVRPCGRGGLSLTIDRDWALITFALKVRGDNLRALQLAFQDAWDQRSELISAGGNRESLAEEMKKIQGVLDTSVRNVLIQDQMAIFESLRNRGGGGRSGGGRGGR